MTLVLLFPTASTEPLSAPEADARAAGFPTGLPRTDEAAEAASLSSFPFLTIAPNCRTLGRQVQNRCSVVAAAELLQIHTTQATACTQNLSLQHTVESYYGF
jgi:hypothetical protein